MDFLKIALLQIAPCRTQEANLKKGIEYCRRAKSLGADIVLFPEMWSNGYGICGRPAGEWMRDAIPADGDFVNTFGKTARELEIAVGITFLEKYGERARNTLVLFDRFGKKRLTYAKVHTCDFGAERSLTPGEAFYTVDLDTACGPVKVGAMICYDREFPESARILMLQGAELILVPNICWRLQHAIILQRSLTATDTRSIPSVPTDMEYAATKSLCMRWKWCSSRQTS